MTNNQIAELLRAVAASYELKGEEKSSRGRSASGRNRFKIIAYQRAADAVEHASSELKDLWDEGKLEEVPGIGKSIAQHLDELFRIGKSKHFEEVMKGLPPAMFELMEVPGIGAKTAYKLVSALKITSLDQLERAAKEGRIAGIEGFGQQSQSDILKSIAEVKGRTKRHLLPYAANIAYEVIKWLKSSPAVREADPLGSLRRKASTVGDVDIAVSTHKPSEVLEHFVKYPKVQRILEKGDRTASIVVPGDMQVDLMVQPPEAYGSLLQHFTGSKHHNIALREYALRKNLSLSEYGIRKRGSKALKKFRDEKLFYGFLGLDLIPPELREDTGEIEAAADHKLPHLVEVKEIRADLQIHSDFDIETSHDLGESSMEEIVRKAEDIGYEYIAFTEHNPSKSKHSEAQIVNLLKMKREVVDKINYSISQGKFSRIKKVFNSLEIDILPEGGLPVSDKGLSTLDFALVSIHSSFRLGKGEMTKRLISSLENPKVRIFAHPTARKLNEREGIELDWDQVFEFCIKNNKWLEINADPARLDLPDFLVKEATEKGVKLTLGTDAHHKDALDNMQFGVSVARRGWATREHIVNTLCLEEFEKVLE